MFQMQCEVFKPCTLEPSVVTIFISNSKCPRSSIHVIVKWKPYILRFGHISAERHENMYLMFACMCILMKCDK